MAKAPSTTTAPSKPLKGTKPATEIQLYDLQEKYLKNRSPEHYQEIFSVIYSYARSLILKKTKGKVFIPGELVADVTTDATIRFMQQYEKPDFRIDVSFGKVLSFKVLEAMYGPKIKAADSILSLNDHIETSKTSGTEIQDLPESKHFTYLFRPDGDRMGDDPAEAIVNDSSQALDTIQSVVTDLHISMGLGQAIIITCGLRLFIDKNRYFKTYKELFIKDEKTEAALEECLMEIKNRLSNIA